MNKDEHFGFALHNWWLQEAYQYTSKENAYIQDLVNEMK